jgi:ankyrin repeat/SOCS box protein 13/metal transporter CNNM
MVPTLNIIVSVTLVLLFGEIIPQAACSRNGLAVGAFFAPLVWIFIYVTFPISWPIAKLLDIILGIDHGTFYHRAELKELVQMHADIRDTNSDYDQDELTRDECTIIWGAIDMKLKTAGQCMTIIDKVEMVDYNSVLDRGVMQRLSDKGHSRIPVFLGSVDHIIGMLLVKHLIMVNPDEGVLVRELKLRPIPFVPADKPLYDMLNLFQRGRSHMAMVVDPKDHITLCGILTLEDVIEELIQEEIADETDVKLLIAPPSSVGSLVLKAGSKQHNNAFLTSPLLSPLASLEQHSAESYGACSPRSPCSAEKQKQLHH